MAKVSHNLVAPLFVLVLDLSLKAVDPVHGLGLVVAAGQVHRVGVERLERQQRHDALDGEGAPAAAAAAAAVETEENVTCLASIGAAQSPSLPVDKVAVEHIRVVHRWHPVPLEYVHQVVKLPVDVAAHRDVLPLGHGDVHQRRQLQQRVERLLQNLDQVPGVQQTLVLEPRKQGLDKGEGDAGVGVEAGACMRGRSVGRSIHPSIHSSLALSSAIALCFSLPL